MTAILPTLNVGATGTAVEALQTDLNKAGANLAIDGIYGPLTLSAVVAFKLKHGLADGIIGPVTWAALGATPPPPPPGNYIAMGNIPVTGLTVQTTWYGALASTSNNEYVISNCIQGGTRIQGGWCQNSAGMGYDDNAVGAMGGKYSNLTNQCTWAEDGTNGDIHAGVFGNLPAGTKLEMLYNGNRVVAEKGDISDGGDGASGSHALDLWWQSAKMLGMGNQPANVVIHVVPQSTPTTVPPVYNAADPSTFSVGPT
jgi:peptidoglycan hydrolase-like protein with peptidoglycan-binding domain